MRFQRQFGHSITSNMFQRTYLFRARRLTFEVLNKYSELLLVLATIYFTRYRTKNYSVSFIFCVKEMVRICDSIRFDVILAV